MPVPHLPSNKLFVSKSYVEIGAKLGILMDFPKARELLGKISSFSQISWSKILVIQDFLW